MKLTELKELKKERIPKQNHKTNLKTKYTFEICSKFIRKIQKKIKQVPDRG